MTRRVFIVHGFEGNPHGNWFDWLAAQARACGVQAGALAMPNPGNPTVQSWQFTLDQHIGKPDENAFLVGHSLGCITLLHFLCRQQPERIGGLVLAAGFADPLPPLPQLDPYITRSLYQRGRSRFLRAQPHPYAQAMPRVRQRQPRPARTDPEHGRTPRQPRHPYPERRASDGFGRLHRTAAGVGGVETDAGRGQSRKIVPRLS